MESLSQADSILLRPCDQMADGAELQNQGFFFENDAQTQGETEERMRVKKLKLQELLELRVYC